MNFKSFILESISFKDIISSIKKNHLSGPLLWRGMLEQDDEFGIKTVRKNRVSRSGFDLHDEFNDAFNKKFKHKLRSESLFCTIDNFTANTYGKAYIIIPKDKPICYYSKYVRDLYDYNEDKLNSNFSKIYDSNDDLNVKIEKIVNTYIENKKFKQINDEVEVMIICNEYYYINPTNLPIEAWQSYEELLKYLEEF